MSVLSNVMIIEGDYDTILLKSKEVCVEILGKKFERKIKKNICSDVIFVESKNKLSIGVSEVRQIQEKLLLKPVECNYKVYIFRNAQNLTEQAQNALLKIFEEPPKYVVFLLLCKNYKLLLPTIVSRSNLILVSDFCDKFDSTKDRDCDKIVKYLINGNKIKLTALLTKYSEKSELVELLNKSKSKILEGIVNNEINSENIFICDRINYYINLICNNVNRSIVFLLEYP